MFSFTPLRFHDSIFISLCEIAEYHVIVLALLSKLEERNWIHSNKVLTLCNFVQKQKVSSWVSSIHFVITTGNLHIHSCSTNCHPKCVGSCVLFGTVGDSIGSWEEVEFHSCSAVVLGVGSYWLSFDDHICNSCTDKRFDFESFCFRICRVESRHGRGVHFCIYCHCMHDSGFECCSPIDPGFDQCCCSPIDPGFDRCCCSPIDPGFERCWSPTDSGFECCCSPIGPGFDQCCCSPIDSEVFVK